jgi:uncharacterized protein (DUF305 family)
MPRPSNPEERKEGMRMTNAAKLLLFLLIGAALAACGEDDQSAGTADDNVTANGVDRAFATAMVPHHRSAVEMATIAQRESKRDEIKELAASIISTQTDEIEQLEAVDQLLQEARVQEGELGVAEHEMGMDDDASMLEDARPFDREFIDMMIAHHQGAIRMARAQLDKGENAELTELAQTIVDGQSNEIDQMNTWRVEWFGGVSPSGGVPADKAGGHSGHGM